MTDELPDRFEDLPPEVQHEIIIDAIADRQPFSTYQGKRYDLPAILQATYRCENNHTRTCRFFTIDLIKKGGIRKVLKCFCREETVLMRTNAEIDMVLDRQQLRGLHRYLADEIDGESTSTIGSIGNE